MTAAALEALVLDELAKARLRLQYEVRRSPTGLYVSLWSDFAWMEGVGGRRFLGHHDGRRHLANIGFLTLHSRAPTIVFGGAPGSTDPLQTLHPPPRCPEAVLRALLAFAIARTVPTPRRLHEARRRMRAAGVRLSGLQRRPALGRRTP